MRLQFRLARFSKMLTYQLTYLNTNFYNTTFNLLAPAPPQPRRTYTAGNGMKVHMLSGALNDVSRAFSTSEITFGTQMNASSAMFANDTLRDQTYDKIISAIKELCIYGINSGVISEVCRFCINFLNEQNRYCLWITEPNEYFDPDADKCSRFNSIHNDMRKYELHTVK